MWAMTGKDTIKYKENDHAPRKASILAVIFFLATVFEVVILKWAIVSMQGFGPNAIAPKLLLVSLAASAIITSMLCLLFFASATISRRDYIRKTISVLVYLLLLISFVLAAIGTLEVREMWIYRLDNEDIEGIFSIIDSADSELLLSYLQESHDVNKKNSGGKSALMHASERGDIDMVSILIEHGAHVNDQNKNGITPLMYAAMEGHVDMVIILLDKGAQKHLADTNGWTALDWAHIYKQRAVEEILSAT